MIRKFQPQIYSDTEVFQTVMLKILGGREFQHSYSREILENMLYDLECQWGDDKRSNKGVPVTRNENPTDRRCQHGKSDEGTKPLENKHELRF